jgi:hypothetical protein
MKYLTDKDILIWNDRINDSNYRLLPRYNTRNGYPDISISYIKETFGHKEIVETPEPVIQYEFSFSIIENRKEHFFILLERMFKNEFKTHFIYNDGISKIEIYKESDIEKSEITHSLLNRNFKKYTYRFKGKLASIIGYISYLEDAINFFQKIWGYNEDGSEVCLTNYKIGDVVSLKDDKSKDYLVIDYNYIKKDNFYIVNYIISEMIANINSSVIQYGVTYIKSDNDLTFSRNSRIDDILN